MARRRFAHGRNSPRRFQQHSRALQNRNKPTPALKKPGYHVAYGKVVEKKIRRTGNLRAPEGFTFVPSAHYPDLTRLCKELCQKHNVHATEVSTPSQKDRNKVSHHVHRVGYHFPNKVVDEACEKLHYVFRHGKFEKSIPSLEDRLAASLAAHSSQIGQIDQLGAAQETEGQILAAIRDLFPKVPDADLQSITSHAFQEGKNRIGTQRQIPLARRVQLAVTAHIRHTYTDYDRLLQNRVPWSEARARVESDILSQLKKWRDDDSSSELIESWRELIVIDDSDDEDAGEDDYSVGSVPRTREQSDDSVEIILTRKAPRDLAADDSDDVVPNAVIRGMRRQQDGHYHLRPIPNQELPSVSHGQSRYSAHAIPIGYSPSHFARTVAYHDEERQQASHYVVFDDYPVTRGKYRLRPIINRMPRAYQPGTLTDAVEYTPAFSHSSHSHTVNPLQKDVLVRRTPSVLPAGTVVSRRQTPVVPHILRPVSEQDVPIPSIEGDLDARPLRMNNFTTAQPSATGQLPTSHMLSGGRSQALPRNHGVAPSQAMRPQEQGRRVREVIDLTCSSPPKGPREQPLRFLDTAPSAAARTMPFLQAVESQRCHIGNDMPGTPNNSRYDGPVDFWRRRI